MKFTFPFILFYFLQSGKANAGIIRGSTTRRLQQPELLKMGGSGGGGGGSGGGGEIRFKDGCPRSKYWNEPAYEGLACNTNADCVNNPYCDGVSNCCCVNNFAPWCGNPDICNPFLSCKSDDDDDSPPSDDDDRDPDDPYGDLIAHGCNIANQEMWCAVLNRCTQQSTCDAVVTDEHGCVTDYGEEWCGDYNLCMYPNINFLCPTVPVHDGVCNTKIYFTGIASSGNDVCAMQYGQMFRYQASTTIRGVLCDGGDNTVTDINLSLLHQDWQFPLSNGVGGDLCAKLYEIKVYMAQNLCLLHVCWDNILDYDELVASNYDISIPFCGDPGLNLPSNNFYVLTFMVW